MVVLAAVLLAAVPSAIVAMHQDGFGVSPDSLTGQKEIIAAQASSQNNDVDFNGSLPLFDINGDGILDRFSTSWPTFGAVFISENGRYIKKKI